MQANQHRALSSASSRAVLRFGVRLALLAVLAALTHAGFRNALPGFVFAGGIFCALWAVLRREPLFAPILTHWDEAALLVILGRAASIAL
jgi:hypothetical protein